MKTEIIKLYDNENYNYPYIEIKEGFLLAFEFTLKAYQTNEEYNIDDFINILKSYKWFIREINPNKEIYF